MFGYLLFFCAKTHAKLRAHMAHTKHFATNLFLFPFHRTKNPLSSNNRLGCHATHSSITSYFLEKT